MKRYINIKKINLNESRVRLVEADPANQADPDQNNTNQSQPNNTGATLLNKSQLEAFTKDCTDKMDIMINAGYLDANNARYANIFDEKTNKQIIDAATSKNSTALAEAKQLRDLVGKIANINGNDYKVVLPEMLEAAKNLVEFVDNLSQQQWIYGVVKSSKTFDEYILRLRGIIDQYNNIIKNINNPTMQTFSDLINAIVSHQVDTKISLGDFENLDKLYKALGKALSKKFYDKLDNALAKTQTITIEEGEKIVNTINTFKEVLSKLKRSFINKALTSPTETANTIKTVFDNGEIPDDSQTKTTKTAQQLAYELIHQELLGKNVRSFNPTNIFYIWELNKASQKLNEKIPGILTELKDALEDRIWQRPITNIQELQAFVIPMNKVISYYSPIYMTDKTAISDIVGNSGWAECIALIRDIIYNNIKTLVPNEPGEDSQQKASNNRDWETELKNAANDQAKLSKIWNEYFNTVWNIPDKPNVLKQAQTISKALINELLTFGFTDTLNPFLAYLHRHVDWMEKGLWTEQKYNAIHNAYKDQLINEQALRGLDLGGKDESTKSANIINSEKLIVENEAGTIYDYLIQQGKVFAIYESGAEFSSDVLSTCYLTHITEFITDLFYEPGNPLEINQLITDTAPEANSSEIAALYDRAKKSGSKGIGDLNNKMKTLTDIKEQFSVCFKNKQNAETKSPKYAVDIIDLANKVTNNNKNKNNIKPFIAYLYVTNGAPQEALTAMNKHNIDENTVFNVASAKDYAKLIKNLNITEANVAEIIDKLATAVGI